MVVWLVAFLFVCVLVGLFVLFVCLTVWCVFVVCLLVCLFVCLFGCVFVCVFACLFVWLVGCLICLFGFLRDNLFGGAVVCCPLIVLLV